MTTPWRSLSPLRLLMIPFSVFLLLIASLAAALYSEAQYHTRQSQAVGVQAHILADTATAALSFGDRAALQEYVNALAANRELESAGVFDTQGRLLAGFTRSRLAPLLGRNPGPQADGRVIVEAPVVQGGQRLGVVYLASRVEPWGQRLARYLAPALLILMALLMFTVMTFDARSLRRANQALQNQIAERERVEAALRQSQKMEAVGRLTGGIAHDFNNMLAIVLGSLDLLLRRHADADPRLLRFAREAMAGAEKAAALTRRLLAFSRLAPLKPVSADITRTVGDMAEMLRRTLGEMIEVEMVMAAGLWRAFIDVAQLETAILNLAINARDAMPEGGRLTIETGNAYLDRNYTQDEPDVRPGQYVMVAITDTGVGIPRDLLSQVIEPFFTTKPAGLGTGLGLSQVHGFIKQSGGHLRLYSEQGVGTTIKLYIPRSTQEAEHPGAMLRLPPGDRRGVSVLVVEDEAGVREFVCEALAELGFDVLAADSAAAALETLERHPEIALLLSDVVMPQMNGRELANRALKRRPDLKVVFMTGYTRNAIVHNGALDPGTYLVSKPFTVAQLSAELEAALSDESANGFRALDA